MSCLQRKMGLHTEATTASRKETLLKSPLAFASEPSLVSATSRLVVEIPDDDKKDDVRLMNVEVFDPFFGDETKHDKSEVLPLVIYFPGVCESAETLSVQNLAQACCRPTLKEGQHPLPAGGKVRLAVLEFMGHGLSDGSPGVCPDFDALVLQALHSVHAITRHLLPTKASNSDASYSIPASMVLCGSSLGGSLALYAAEYLSRQFSMSDNLERWPSHSASHSPSSSAAMEALEELDWSHLVIEQSSGIQPSPAFYFAGVLSITPAVGVDPRALPPSWMVSALSVAANLLPSATQVPLTPFEDPSHYNCPPDTQRNFSGHWPLSTSKMLLDLTSKRVPNDVVATSSGQNDQLDATSSSPAVLSLHHIPQVVLVAGANDFSIPVESIQAVHDCLQSPSKEVRVLQKAGHDVLVRHRSSAKVVDILQSLLFTSTITKTIH